MTNARTKIQEAIEKFQLGRNLGGLVLLASVLADIQKQEDLYAAILLDSQVDKQQIADLQAQLVCPTCRGLKKVAPDTPAMYNCELGGTCKNTPEACKFCGKTEDCPSCTDGTMKSCLEKLRAEIERLKKLCDKAMSLAEDCEDFASATNGGDSVQIVDICQEFIALASPQEKSEKEAKNNETHN